MNFSTAKEQLLEIAQEFEEASYDRYSETIEATLDKFIELSDCATCPIIKLMKDREVQNVLPSLRKCSARAEFLLEYHWAERILKHDNPAQELTHFPFYNYYVDLARFEYHSLSAVSPTKLKKILLVGSGPVCLSSICLVQQNPTLRVDNLDIDRRAVLLSDDIVEKIGLQERLKTKCAAIEDIQNFDEYDAVIIAALVGNTEDEKKTIIAHLARHMNKTQFLLLRTVHGTRSLLFPKVGKKDVEGFQTVSMIHRYQHRVNSFLIAQKFV